MLITFLIAICLFIGTSQPATAHTFPQHAQDTQPAIPVDVALQIGERYQRDGRFENAVYTYEMILEQGDSVPADIRAQAAYNMGQAALREGLFEYALYALNLLIDNFSSDYRGVLGYFLRGDAHSGLGMWQEAINDYQQYIALRPNVIDSYAYERIGDAYINLGQYSQALAHYNLATQATRSRIPQAALMEKVARLHLLHGEVSEAVAQYDGILAFAQTYTYRASIDLLGAQVLMDSGDVARGLVRMERVFRDYGDTPSGYEAMLTLLEHDMQLNHYQVGMSYFHAERYAEAIEAFNRYTSATLLTEIPPQLYIYLGQSFRALGNFDAAQIAFRTVTEQFPTHELFGEGLLEGGRTYFMQGDIPRAIERYLFIAETYQYLPATSAEAFWRAAYLHNTNDNPQESWAIFLRLADLFPNSEQARSGLSLAANNAVLAGHNLSAETLYSRLATISAGTQQAEAYFSLGRLLQAKGDTSGAINAYNQAILSAPDSYYGSRAYDLVNGKTPFARPAETVWAFDDATQVSEAENWLRQRFGITQEGVLWPLSPALEVEPRIVRGRELWAVGAFDEARIEFNDIITEYANDPLASYQLAIYTRIIGAYRPSISAASNLVIASQTSTRDVPLYIARLRYPAYYADEVRRISEAYNIDPLLMLSLIRHESLFDTYATAAAGEKGLTQVIPSTAQYIAEQLAWSNYQHSELFRPYAGIEFGAFYLAEQLNRFNHLPHIALSGYNAGPGRAIAWREVAGDDIDLFVSAITISSTQSYVQLIYINHSMYQHIYGAN
jgi:soluble lytic murein transglycosylase